MSTVSYLPRVPVAVRTAQFLSLLLALPMAFGSVMFSLITPDRHHAAWVTWVFAPISFTVAVGLLMTVPRLGHSRSAPQRTVQLLLAAVVFSLVKLTVFGEVESIPFLVLALTSLALLVRHRPGRVSHPEV